jgi:hypothetical protein
MPEVVKYERYEPDNMETTLGSNIGLSAASRAYLLRKGTFIDT